MKAINPDQQYLSTRQSAKILQVSLGTVQKMVEEGDLVAWKTRGGHRRILATSLNQQLRRRKLGLQESASKQQYLALGIFRRPENLVQMRSAIESWSLRLDLVGSIDSLEGLMQAVSLYPDVIYLDSLIPPVEQLHLIHYLSKNIQTRRIPMLVDEAFVQLHPGVLDMAQENIQQLRPPEFEEPIINEALNQLPEKSTVFSYSADSEQGNDKRNPRLETLFVEALNNASKVYIRGSTLWACLYCKRKASSMNWLFYQRNANYLIKNLVRSLPAIHLGALPRPVQVSPVDGFLYFAATLPRFLPTRFLLAGPFFAGRPRLPFATPLRPNRSPTSKPNCSMISLALAIPSAFSRCIMALIWLSNFSRCATKSLNDDIIYKFL